jgi:hypothetical protein
MISFYFFSNPNSNVVSRVFQTFPDFLANVPAMISNFLFLIVLLITYINEHRLNESMINKIISFKEHLFTKNEMVRKFKEIEGEIEVKNCKNSEATSHLNSKSTDNI